MNVPSRQVGWVLVGITLALVAAIASVVFGARGVTFADIVGGLDGDPNSLGEAAVVARLPRTVLALGVGAALGVSGATMQALTRNPVADPGILGVSTGAGLGVVIGLVWFGISSPYAYLGCAVAGASAAAMFVYGVSASGRGGVTPLSLALAGAATTAAGTALIGAILLPRAEVLSQFRFWQIGGVGGADWSRISIVAPFLVAGTLVCFASARGLNALALGDDVAVGLGVSVGRTRLVAAGGAVLLCAAATSVAGPILFVGLIVPHLARLMVGVDHRWLLPAAAAGGATLLVVADIVGRVLARPAEIESGVVTAVVGAPVLIWVVARSEARAW